MWYKRVTDRDWDLAYRERRISEDRGIYKIYYDRIKEGKCGHCGSEDFEEYRGKRYGIILHRRCKTCHPNADEIKEKMQHV